MPLNSPSNDAQMPRMPRNPWAQNAQPGGATPSAGARSSPMAAKFPGLTDQQILEMRDRDPGGFVAAMQGGAPKGPTIRAQRQAAAPKPPSAPPEAAGAINAQMPGYFNPMQPVNGASPQIYGALPTPTASTAPTPQAMMPTTSLASVAGAAGGGVASPANTPGVQMPAGVSPGRTVGAGGMTAPANTAGAATGPVTMPSYTGSLGNATVPAFDRDPRRAVPGMTGTGIGGYSPTATGTFGGAEAPSPATIDAALRALEAEIGGGATTTAGKTAAPVAPPAAMPQASAGLATPQSWATAAAGEEGSAEAAAADAAPGSAPEDAGKPWQGDTRTFEEMFGGPKPAGWGNWSQSKRAAWKAANYQAAGAGGTGTGGDAGGDAGGTGGDTGTGTGTGGTGDAGQTGGEAAAATYAPGDPATYWNADGTPTWSAADIRAMESEDRNFLQPKPAGFAGWDRARKDQWLAANFNPYGTTQGYIQNAPFDVAMTQFAKVYGGDIPGVSQRQIEGADPREDPVAIPGESSLADWSRLLGNDPVAIGLVDKAENAFRNLQQASENLSAYGGKVPQEFLDTYYATTAALGRLNINYDPWASYQDPGYNDPGYDDGRTPEGSGGDTDIATQLPDFDKFVSDIKQAFRGESPERLAAITEAAMQRWILENSLQNQQRGVNISQEELDRLRNDPMRIEAEQAALGMFDDPSGVDYQGIRNRLASDYDAGLENYSSSLAQSAGRRGLTGGTIAGITGNLTAQNRNELSRALGELSTQEDQATREGLYRAIENAANTNRAFSGAESIARQNLASMVAGAPATPQNPYSGMANSASNVAALELQRRLAEQEDDGGYGSLVGSILGAGAAFIPGAGVAGAALGSQIGSRVGGAFG